MNPMTSPLASAAAQTLPAEPSDWRLGPQVPQSRSRFTRWLGLRLLRLAGWRFEGAMPDLPKFVCIVAHHTSNWDFPVGLAGKWALGFDPKWLGKHTLFVPPAGWFLRHIGGIPVDRASRANIVGQVLAEFAARDRFVLVLAPEGTRKRVAEWKSGFWHVARRAEVPIVCVALDWGRKVIRLGPTTTAHEDDPAVGIARIRGYFADTRGFDPGKETPLGGN
jgi:1-acyl-sn-glycerol-3-phosphate acyltransferase